eukprot:g4589.t1
MTMSFQRAAFHGEYEAASYVARKRLRNLKHGTRREQRQTKFYHWYEREGLKQLPREQARPVKARGEIPASAPLPETVEEARKRDAAEALAKRMMGSATRRTDAEVLASEMKDGIAHISAYTMMRRKQGQRISEPGSPEPLHKTIAAKDARDLTTLRVGDGGGGGGGGGSGGGGEEAAQRKQRQRRASRPFNVVLQDEPGAYRGVLRTDAYQIMASSIQRRRKAMGPAPEQALNRRLGFFMPDRKQQAAKALFSTASVTEAAGKFRRLTKKPEGGSTTVG